MIDKILLFLLLLLSVNTRSYASIAFQDTSTHILDSIIIHSRIISQSIHTTPYTITKVNLPTLRSGINRTTSEALMGTAGVFIQKTNHGGGSPFIRGLTGNQTLLLLDGIRLNNSTFRYGPNQYLNTIDIFAIQSIEIQKGSGAVEYGSDAIGGAILLKSELPNYSASSTLLGDALLKYTSDDLEKTNRIALQYTNQTIAAKISYTKRNFGDLIGGGNIGKQSPSGYDEDAINFKIKTKLNANNALTLSSQSLQQNHVPIYHKVILENFSINEISKQQKKIHYIKWEYNSRNKIFSSIQLIYSLQKALEVRENIKNNSSIYRYETDRVVTYGKTFDIVSIPSKYWKINSGIEIYNDIVNSETKEKNILSSNLVSKRGLYPDNSRYQNLAIFNLHKYSWKSWNFEAGLRYNQFKIILNDMTSGKVNISPKAFVQNIGIHYKIKKIHNLNISVASGYRAPNIDDMGSLGIIDFRYEVPSFKLRPEKSIVYEVGYGINDSNFNFKISAFYLNLKDVITRKKINDSLIQGYPVYIKENTEFSKIMGFEFESMYIFSSQLSFHSNLTYTYGQNITKNEPMRRIPPIFGTNCLVWKYRNTEITAQHQFAGKQLRLAQGDKDDNRIGPNGTNNWNQLNLNVKHTIRKIQLQYSCINIFNEKYKTHGSGIYGMGRAFSIQMNTILHITRKY